ncbi:MAG: hypothetical protein PHG04_02265 [Candidatus Nanoarchaeia archaeon]|nr:hypothetical protein [Candidatus Nanoarchaeia archaeon]MDD5054182.1 hypothetical protein [Candidatus Nanoarchaeia archaeon]
MNYPKKWKCPNCGEIVEKNKLCPNCKFRFSNSYPQLWNCPNCNNLISDSEFCKTCKYPNILSFPQLWHCHECSSLVKDSAKCDVCGFEKKELNGKNDSEPIIEKKLKKNDFLNKKSGYLIAGGIIVLCFILIIFSLGSNNYLPEEQEFFAGVQFSKDFALASNIESAAFEFKSVSGKTIILSGEKKDKNIWSINDLTLNESGIWEIKITCVIGHSYFELTDYLNMKSSCNVDDDCINGVCCLGACLEECE